MKGKQITSDEITQKQQNSEDNWSEISLYWMRLTFTVIQKMM